MISCRAVGWVSLGAGCSPSSPRGAVGVHAGRVSTTAWPSICSCRPDIHGGPSDRWWTCDSFGSCLAVFAARVREPTATPIQCVRPRQTGVHFIASALVQFLLTDCALLPGAFDPTGSEKSRTGISAKDDARHPAATVDPLAQSFPDVSRGDSLFGDLQGGAIGSPGDSLQLRRRSSSASFLDWA
jgi:hypothetical protein